MQQTTKEKLKKIRKILKWTCFILFSQYIYVCLLIIPLFFCSFLESFFENDPADPLEFILVNLIYIPIAISPFLSYLYAKLFGFFKIIDNMQTTFLIKLRNVFLTQLLLSTSSLLLYIFIFCIPNDHFHDYTLAAGIAFVMHPCALLPAFFLYKLFQHLTKKYPKPFEKIAYYSSIEFYKQIIKNLYKKIKKPSK